MSLATDLKTDITAAIAEFGTAATFRSIAHGARVIGSGSAPDVITESSIKVIPSSYSAFEIGNGVATETDIKILADGADFSTPPTHDDQIELLGVIYVIGRVETSILQGTKLIYTIKLRGN